MELLELAHSTPLTAHDKDEIRSMMTETKNQKYVANNGSIIAGYPTGGAVSKATTSNPKDALGSKKIPLGQVLPVAMAHEACAMLDGDLKYGFRNWRSKPVVARIYIDAALRHIQQWAEGEETAEDSKVHHLGHARACLGILLDAQETGNLIDDRAPGVFTKVQERLSEWVKERMRKHHESNSGN